MEIFKPDDRREHKDGPDGTSLGRKTRSDKGFPHQARQTMLDYFLGKRGSDATSIVQQVRDLAKPARERKLSASAAGASLFGGASSGIFAAKSSEKTDLPAAAPKSSKHNPPAAKSLKGLLADGDIMAEGDAGKIFFQNVLDRAREPSKQDTAALVLFPQETTRNNKRSQAGTAGTAEDMKKRRVDPSSSAGADLAAAIAGEFAEADAGDVGAKKKKVVLSKQAKARAKAGRGAKAGAAASRQTGGGDKSSAGAAAGGPGVKK